MSGIRTIRRTPSYRRLHRSSGNDLAFVDLDGHRRYLGAFDTPESREKYHRLIAEWEAAGGILPPKPEEISVAELTTMFLVWADGYYLKHGKATSEPANIRLAVRPLTQLYGRSNAAEFGPKAMKVVRQAMVDKGWCRRQVNHQVNRIKRMFKWAVAEELLPSSVHHGLLAVTGLKRGRCEARETGAVRPVEENLIEPVKQHVSKQVVAIIELQLLTGARPGEIVIMRPCDIDRTQPVWVYRPSEHKTEHHGHDRVIFIGPKAQGILSSYLLRPGVNYCFSPAEADQDRREARHKERVTPPSYGNSPGSNQKEQPRKKPGSHYTTQSYGRAIRDACFKAFPLPEALARGEKETHKAHKARLTKEQYDQVQAWYAAHYWHPHQLRHNYATSVRKQYGLEAAQVLLGHSSADVTQVYAERDMGRATQVAAKIG